MKLSFYPRYSIAYIRLKEGPTQVETIQVSDERNIDLTPDGKMHGIELLNANQQLSQLAGGRFVVENEATGKP